MVPGLVRADAQVHSIAPGTPNSLKKRGFATAPRSFLSLLWAIRPALARSSAIGHQNVFGPSTQNDQCPIHAPTAWRRSPSRLRCGAECLPDTPRLRDGCRFASREPLPHTELIGPSPCTTSLMVDDRVICLILGQARGWPDWKRPALNLRPHAGGGLLQSRSSTGPGERSRRPVVSPSPGGSPIEVEGDGVVRTSQSAPPRAATPLSTVVNSGTTSPYSGLGR